MVSAILLSALRKAFNERSDGAPQLYYFPGEYFGVKTSPFSFLHKGHVLRGHRFFIPAEKYKGVLIFFHGMGAGYTAYSQEMAYFALHGYLVYGYDYLGCMTSEGRNIEFLCEPLLAQEDFFRFLDQDEPAKGLDRYAVRHSWGGYTALGACRQEFNVKAIVSIAGFTSSTDMICSQVPKLEKYRGLIDKAIKRGYGSFAASDLIETAKTSHARILYIQGENDTMVLPKFGLEKFRIAFPNDPRVRVVAIPEVGHNPYWTKAGQAYMVDLFRNHRLTQRDFDNQVVVDYAKLNEDDPAFMKMMLDFLEDVDKPAAGE